MTRAEHVERPTGTPPSSAEWVGRAWIAVALIPVFFFVAFALGYVLYDLLGYKPENDDAPFWADLVATLPVIAVFLAPCVAAVIYGRRANSVGDRRGLGPVIIGALVGLAGTILSIASLVGSY